MQITHLGHACMLIEAAGARVLIDPGTFSEGFEELTGLDAIWVTHQHPDHLDPKRFAPLVAGNEGAVLVTDGQTRDQLQRKGVQAREAVPGSVVQVGALSLHPVGQLHAVIHEYIPRVHNLGVVVRAPGEPVFFHPGDAYDADPGQVDVLGVPLNAPWCAVKETIAFVRRVGPSEIVPIHDGLLTSAARAMYLGHVGEYGADGGVSVRDLAGGARAELG